MHKKPEQANQHHSTEVSFRHFQFLSQVLKRYSRSHGTAHQPAKRSYKSLGQDPNKMGPKLVETFENMQKFTRHL